MSPCGRRRVGALKLARRRWDCLAMVSCAGRFARLFRDVEARAAYNQDAKSEDFAPAMPEDHYRNALVRILRKSSRDSSRG
jgi:hypothetical protein